jgi:hypothetical protein
MLDFKYVYMSMEERKLQRLTLIVSSFAISFPDRKCPKCTHTSIQHFSYFNKKIVIPIQAYGYVAEGKIAMLRLQNDVLQHVSR